MSLDLIVVGPNGQLEFDFESLAAETSEGVVAKVKMLAKGYVLEAVSVSEDDGFVHVEFYANFNSGRRAWFYIVTYHPVTSIIDYSAAFWSNREQKWKKVRE